MSEVSATEKEKNFVPPILEVLNPNQVKYQTLMRTLVGLQKWGLISEGRPGIWRDLLALYKKPTPVESQQEIDEAFNCLNSLLQKLICDDEVVTPEQEFVDKYEQALIESKPRGGLDDAWAIIDAARVMIFDVEEKERWNDLKNDPKLVQCFNELNLTTEGDMKSLLTGMYGVMGQLETYHDWLLKTYVGVIFMTIFGAVYALPYTDVFRKYPPTPINAELLKNKKYKDLKEWLQSLALWNNFSVVDKNTDDWKMLKCFKKKPLPAQNLEVLVAAFSMLNNLIHELVVEPGSKIEKDPFSKGWKEAEEASKPKIGEQDIFVFFLEAKTLIETAEMRSFKDKLDKKYLSYLFEKLDASTNGDLDNIFAKMLVILGILKDGSKSGQVNHVTISYICMIFVTILAAVYIIPFISPRKIYPTSLHITLPDKDKYHTLIEKLTSLQKWDKGLISPDRPGMWVDVLALYMEPIPVESQLEIDDAFIWLNSLLKKLIFSKYTKPEQEFVDKYKQASIDSKPKGGLDDPWAIFDAARIMIFDVEKKERWNDLKNDPKFRQCFDELSIETDGDMVKLINEMLLIMTNLESEQDWLLKIYVGVIFMTIFAAVYALPYVAVFEKIPPTPINKELLEDAKYKDLKKWLEGLPRWNNLSVMSEQINDWKKLKCFKKKPLPVAKLDILVTAFTMLNNLIYELVVEPESAIEDDPFSNGWKEAEKACLAKPDKPDIFAFFLAARTLIETAEGRGFKDELEFTYLINVYKKLDASSTGNLDDIFGKMLEILGSLKDWLHYDGVNHVTTSYICMILVTVLAAVYIIPFISTGKPFKEIRSKVVTLDESPSDEIPTEEDGFTEISIPVPCLEASF
ncbi:hypothetical protein Ciccas_012275 [Cichlidogyrus casuarinus]|uniref:Uncharacterized protein n=1 Tax=Cichlidogyrus casuarinus TaxID=1844966 RepID=A0ABD2PNU0_9PLAT